MTPKQYEGLPIPYTSSEHLTVNVIAIGGDRIKLDNTAKRRDIMAVLHITDYTFDLDHDLDDKRGDGMQEWKISKTITRKVHNEQEL